MLETRVYVDKSYHKRVKKFAVENELKIRDVYSMIIAFTLDEDGKARYPEVLEVKGRVFKRFR